MKKPDVFRGKKRIKTYERGIMNVRSYIAMKPTEGTRELK